MLEIKMVNNEKIATSLPFNSTIGLTWSDAYIGQFPNFGLGVTIGATTIPFAATESIASSFGISMEDQFPAFLTQYGLPLPAYSIDARVGGFLIPFDIGFKIGYIPDETKALMPDSMSGLNYMLIGGDFRFALVQDKRVAPDVSIGLGLYHLDGSFSMPGLLGGNQEITNVGGHTISLSDPELYFYWNTWTVDAKAQVSKDILFITPYLGLGASYAWSEAGGGLESEVLYDGNPITQTDIDTINSILGDDAPDLSDTNIVVGSEVTGWAFRAFGGVSFNIFFLRVDVNALYNFISQSIGASVNVRLQFSFGDKGKDEENN